MTIYRGQGGLGDSYNDPELVHTSGDETIEGVKTFTSTIIGTISGHYTKAEEDTKLALKANQSTTYTKTEVDTALALKLNAANPSYSGTLTGGTDVVNLGSGQFYKDVSGNVGIGTSSPASRLHVFQSGTGELLRVGDGISTFSFSPNGSGEGVIKLDTANPIRFFNAGGERARIDSSGNWLVGTTSNPNACLAVFQRASSASNVDFRTTATVATNQCVFTNGNGVVGTIATSGTSTTYVTSSDYRLKENVQPMQNALATVAQLNPVTYTWKADGSDGQGFIAHELQEVVPDCVTGEKDAVDADGNPVYQGIDTSFLVATLTAAIQEQQAMIEQLKADVAALKGAA